MAKKKRLKTRRARAMVVIGFVVVAAVAGYLVYRAYSGSSEAQVTYTAGTVEKMTLSSYISGTGNVALTNSATVDPGISGEVSGLSVALGDTVEAGQLLFTIVNPELDLAVTNAENSYNEAELNLSKAELSVLQAKQSLADLWEQYEAQSESESTSSTAPATSTTQAHDPPLSTTSTVPETTTTTAPAATTTTESPATTTTESPTTTTTASAAAAATGLYTAASGYDASTVQLLAAAAGSSNTEQSGGSEITYLDIEAAEQAITSAELSVVSAEVQLASAELAVQTAKENAAKREVRAPISGTITALDIENGDTIGGSSGSSGGDQDSSGSSDTGGSSSMTITDLEAFTATITLAESDIFSVELGQKAVITFDALPDLTLTGRITSIDTTGANNQGVVSYSVVVTPDATDPSVKGGMTVSVNIITQVATDVLAVPSTAIKSQGTDGSKYVQVLENDTPASVTVETGMSTDSYTEITSGLTEGQEIIVQTVTAGSGSTSTTNRSSGGILEQGGAGSMPSGTPPGGGAGFIGPGQ